MSDTAMNACRLILAVLLAAFPAYTKSTARAGAACVLASYDGKEFTGDIAALRVLEAPAPPVAEARRLAVDAFVADALIHGKPRPHASAKEQLESYGKLVDQVRKANGGKSPTARAHALVDRLAAGRRRFGIELGPCYPQARSAEDRR